MTMMMNRKSLKFWVLNCQALAVSVHTVGAFRENKGPKTSKSFCSLSLFSAVFLKKAVSAVFGDKIRFS